MYLKELPQGTQLVQNGDYRLNKVRPCMTNFVRDGPGDLLHVTHLILFCPELPVTNFVNFCRWEF